jgi:hypothetical protein
MFSVLRRLNCHRFNDVIGSGWEFSFCRFIHALAISDDEGKWKKRTLLRLSVAVVADLADLVDDLVVVDKIPFEIYVNVQRNTLTM